MATGEVTGAEPPLDAGEAAALLRAAAASRVPIPPLRDRLPSADVETAYAVQEANTRAWLAEGRRLVGRKIGLTSRAVQAQLGVDQPDFGMLFADMAVGDGEPVPAGRLIQPKVEAEIALVIGRDLTRERHTYADIIGATDCALPAIEIVDSRIAGWNIRFADTVADNASSGLFVLGGRPRRLADFDIAGCAMEMRRGDAVVSQGSGRACLGNPLTAAVWLADTMVRCGRPLLAGDIVLTGALGPMVAVTPGGPDRFDAAIEGLGSVAALFS
ncbi:2-keto-4-pentenoate hydratase [Azospirillum sp. RWY-5-1]|uniref:2-keto-4-pentenoate hydratase n=1 Tax=Azospirillum oleiclasticum TaxID=2735135 RepID=A0ABX2TD77_9PROT|nr:fumarylacetoacetate hydrolase family protein [Azospirillum oleiclasticum]NYZ13826.1 2-keto-4-pentenoate hydratase [Azospirillum oleiclasticum]NYZ21098.1 2-keto-4-pentenoate hydratase [Azospirillum oleiclasticum]